MDLFICGLSPFVERCQPRACDRWQRGLSNKCTHVPPGRVFSGGKYKICPRSVLAPVHVLGGKQSIQIIPTASQNLLVIDHETVLWTSDGIFAVRRDFGERHMSPYKMRNIQDMWPEPDADEQHEKLFDYGPDFAELGLLTDDGAIYTVNQETDPPTMKLRTSVETKIPFRQALIRAEVNNGKGDTWPHVVFKERPCMIYRLETNEDLLRWIDGAESRFSVLTFSTPIAKLLTCGGIKGEYCMALTDRGRIYRWRRGTQLPFQKGILSHELQKNCCVGPDLVSTMEVRDPTGMTLPPVTSLVAGPSYGAAITVTGQLYIFSTFGRNDILTGQCHRPALADLYIPGPAKSIVYDAFTPCPAKIFDLHQQDRAPQPTIVDVAVGDDHIVVLSSDGDVFTGGEGWRGQLGVGYGQFDLWAEMHHLGGGEESHEFAEQWQQLYIPRDELAKACCGGKNARVIGVGAGFESTLLIVGKGKASEDTQAATGPAQEFQIAIEL